MKVLQRLRRRVMHTAGGDATSPAEDDQPREKLPDPARPPQSRGSWEQAALVNTAITELVKRQIDTVTPPWRK